MDQRVGSSAAGELMASQEESQEENTKPTTPTSKIVLIEGKQRKRLGVKDMENLNHRGEHYVLKVSVLRSSKIGNMLGSPAGALQKETQRASASSKQVPDFKSS